MGVGADHIGIRSKSAGNLQVDLVIKCIVQLGMLRFSAPTSLNKNNLLNDGEILAKYFEAVNLAFRNVLGAPCFGMDTPRILFS